MGWICEFVSSREGPSGVRIDNHLDVSPGNRLEIKTGEHTKLLSVLTSFDLQSISRRAI